MKRTSYAVATLCFAGAGFLRGTVLHGEAGNRKVQAYTPAPVLSPRGVVGAASNRQGERSEPEGAGQAASVSTYTLTLVALQGQATPGGGPAFTLLTRYPVLNDQGDVAFAANYTGQAPGNNRYAGVYRFHDGLVETIADVSRFLPQDPNSPFYNLEDPFIDGAGTVVFNANAGSLGSGAYAGTPTNLNRIASIQTFGSLATPVPLHSDKSFNAIYAQSVNADGLVALKGQAGAYLGVYSGDGGPLNLWTLAVFEP